MSDVSDNVANAESGSRDSVDSFEHVPSPHGTRQRGQRGAAATAPPGERKARLIYCKSHVAIHPTQLKRDNISGLLGLVEVDKDAAAPRVPNSAPDAARSTSDKEVLVVWVPDELLQRMSDEDQKSYQRVEGRPTGTPTEEDGESTRKRVEPRLCSVAVG